MKEIEQIIDELIILEREYKFLFENWEFDLLPEVEKEIRERSELLNKLIGA